MANETCFNILQVCHLRALRLDADGTILESADARYETDQSVLFGYTEIRPERDEFEQKNGCGDECAYFRSDPKAVRSADLSLQLCRQDAELHELLLGGALITDDDDTIGYLSATDTTVNATGVALEVWAKAWNRRQRAIVNGAPGWYRHVFTKTQWTADERQLSNEGFTVPALTGTAEVNSGFGTGFVDDPTPADIGESVYGWWVTDTVPDSECGYLPVPAAS